MKLRILNNKCFSLQYVMILGLVIFLTLLVCACEYSFDIEFNNSTSENIVVYEYNTEIATISPGDKFLAEDLGSSAGFPHPVTAYNQQGELIYSENITRSDLGLIDEEGILHINISQNHDL